MNLLIVIGVAAAVLIASFLVAIVAMLLWPGRKGTMRTTREFTVSDTSAAEIAALIAEPVNLRDLKSIE